jgi:uncharacterized protein (DUF1810 family)
MERGSDEKAINRPADADPASPPLQESGDADPTSPRLQESDDAAPTSSPVRESDDADAAGRPANEDDGPNAVPKEEKSLPEPRKHVGDLQRFLNAQSRCYAQVEREMRAGRKQTHWIWFIFPQIEIARVGVSSYHILYAIHSLEEAAAYLEDPILGERLRTLSQLVLSHRDLQIGDIMGSTVDAMKFRSSMTLFSLVSPDGSIFHQCLHHFFGGKVCPITMRKMCHVIVEGDNDERETECACSVV